MSTAVFRARQVSGTPSAPSPPAPTPPAPTTTTTRDAAPSICGRSSLPPSTLPKLVFVSSVASIVLISMALVCHQSLLLYYYVILTPLLIITRMVQYWKLKWQFFLADFCYFGNVMMHIYIWFLASHTHIFAIIFSLANGPMLLAVILFRNSLVLHSVEKMTSTFIHLLPAYLTLCIRWYPEESSYYWYTSFTQETIPTPDFYWFLLIPFLIFLVHCSVYMVIVHVIIKPHLTYLDSFRYIRSRNMSKFYKLLDVCGERYHLHMYHLMSMLFALCSLSLSQLLYTYLSAHVLYLLLVTTLCTYNGSHYYTDLT